MTQHTLGDFNAAWRQGDLFGTTRTQIRRPFHPCKVCKGIHFHVAPGRGPHAVALACVSCGKFCGWLSKRELEEAASCPG
jgi:hypothetical protein